MLTNLGTVQGGLPLTMNAAPDWSANVFGTGSVPSQVSMDSLTSDAGPTTKAGDVIHVTGTVTNRSGATASTVTAVLSAPSGWTVSPSVPAPIAALDPGKSATVNWTVTAPPVTPAGSYEVVAKATFIQGGTQGTTGSTLTFPVQNSGDIYISDMAWVSSVSGYGTIGRDVAVALAPAVGGPLTMNGKVYTKGIGMNSISTIVVAMPAGCTSFTSTVGLDVGSASKGSVTFNVSGDGTTLLQTPTIATTAVPIAINVNITGVKVLTLTAGDAGNGNGHDNADWGDAQIHCSVQAAAPTIATVAPTAGPILGGTAVTLTGTGFGADSTVSVDGSSPITPTVVATSGTSLTFPTPAHDSGVVGVTVTSGGAVSAARNFTYLPSPTVTAITPNQGPTAGAPSLP